MTHVCHHFVGYIHSTCVFHLAVEYMCLCVAHVRRRGLYLEQIFILYNSSYTAKGTQGISRYTAADAGDATTSKQPSQLWRWSQTFMWRARKSTPILENKKKRKTERRIPFYVRWREKEWYFEDAFFFLIWESSWTNCFLGCVAILMSGCGVFVCVRARGSVTQNEWSTVRERGEIKGVSFPKRGHYRSLLQSCIQPTPCLTVPSSFHL